MKKYIIYILVTVFIFMQIPIVNAQNTVEVIQSGTEVVLSGKLDVTLNNEIISCVVKNKVGKYYYIDSEKTENGEFSFKMKLSDDTPTEELMATFSSEYMNTPFEYSFLYRGNSELHTLLDSLNNAETAQIYGKILMGKYNSDITNMEYLNLDKAKLAGLKAPYDNIYAYIMHHGPYTVDNFSSMNEYYLRSVEIETINQSDANGVKVAMADKGKELGAVVEDSITEKLISGHIISEYTDLIYDKMTRFNIADETGLKNAYDISAALTTIEHPKNGRFDAAYVIENCYETLEIQNEINRFKQLSQTQQAEVLTSLVGNTYTKESFKTAFVQLIDEQENKKVNNASVNGGSSTASNPNIQTTAQNSFKTAAPTQAPQYTFKDIEDVPWAIEAIENLKAKGIVDGKTDEIFDPYANVTREEFVKMIVTALKMEAQDGELPFEDVPEDIWCRKYIRAAYNDGVVYGISDENFGVGLPITRQDLAVMVYRTIKDRGLENGDDKIEFKDENLIADYAIEAVNFLSSNRIVSGKTDGNFDPTSNATRAEAAVIIYQSINYMDGKEINTGDSPENCDDEVSQKEKLLDDLGFVDIKYRGKTELSRGDFIEIAVKLFNYPIQRVDQFLDVDANSQYYEAVGTAAVNGIISDSSNYFYPDKAMKWDEAVRILVNGMGYAPVIENGEQGYTKVAAKLGIIPDTDLSSSISYDSLVNVVYNLLDAEIMEVNYGVYENSYKTGDTLLEAVHDIYRTKGYIIETEISGLYGPSTVGENEIKLKTSEGELRVNMRNSQEYLGHKVEIYFQDNKDEEREVVSIRIIDDNVKVIQGEDVDEYQGNYIRYFENDKAKTIKVSKDAAIVYNGVAITSGEELAEEWYAPENGTVTVIKGTGDIGDVIIVTSYECIVFSASVEKDNTITLHDKYGGKSYTCEKDQIVFYDKNGDEVGLSALSEYDVISICAPPKMNDLLKVRAYVSNYGITGTITSISGNKKKVSLEAEEFKLTDNLAEYIQLGNSPVFKVGQSGEFYLDYFGNIAAFKIENEAESDNLVYLINIFVGDENKSEYSWLKVLTADNKIKTYETKRKITVNDQSVTYDELYEQFTSNGEIQQQLILLKLDDDDIVKSVYTAKDRGDIGRLVKTYTPQTPSETLSYRSATYGFGGRMIIGISATKVFVVPNEKTLSIATNADYVATTRDYFVDGANYHVQGYSVSDENVMEDAVVVYVDAGSENIKITDGSMLGLVDEIAMGVNEDDEDVNIITMMYNGNIQTLYTEEGVDVSDIKSGDAVQIKLNPDNEIQKIRKVFDYETKKVLIGNTYGAFLDGLHLLYGPCINIKDTAIEQESLYSNGVTDTEKFLAQGNFYVYDSSGRGSHIRNGSYTEIQSQRLAGGDATMLLTRRNGGTLRECIIYK